MGGRGGASGLSANQSMVEQFKKAGTKFVETEKLDARAVNESLSAVSDVLKDMGIPISVISVVAGRNGLGKDNLMAVNGMNHLQFSNANYFSYEKASESNKNTDGYFVAGGIRGTATHEAGHLVMNEIINRTMKNSTNLERATARHNGKLEKQIIKEAKKQYGSNPVISKYGSKKPAEKVAEAVSDVYTNKSKANPYSKVIVDIMKKKLRGG